jgi:hypothetical protein
MQALRIKIQGSRMRFVLACLTIQMLTLTAQAQSWSQLYSHVNIGIQVFEILNERARNAASDALAKQEISVSIETFVKTGMWLSGEASDPMSLPDLETLQYRSHGWIAWEANGKSQTLVRSSPSPVGSWLEATYMNQVMAGFTAKYPRLTGVAPALADLVLENFCEFATRENLYARDWQPPSREEFTRRILLLNWVQRASFGRDPAKHVAKIQEIRRALQSSAADINDPRMAALIYFMQSDRSYGF